MNGSECRLCHVHIDERGDSVTLGFDTGPPSSTERLEFHLLFTGVEDLHVSGWTVSDAQEVFIAPVLEGGCSVSLGPRGSGLRFHATAVEVAHMRTYLAYPDETRSADSSQTWETLRGLAVGRLYDDRLAARARLSWAKLAITAGGQRDASSDSTPARTLADEVSVRAYAIREFGIVPGDEIRDASELCETVFRGIGMSRGDVSAEAAAWRELPPARMLRLRHAKNLLTPLRSIMDALDPDDPARSELSAWLDLIPELP